MNDMKKSRFNRISPLTKKKRALQNLYYTVNQMKSVKANSANQKGGNDA